MHHPQRYRLDASGYFSRDGEPFIPIGVNYWPASCGVELWTQWPEDEIKHDLDVLVTLGLNTVRFFQRWQDFEPLAGKYNVAAFKKLRQLLEWHRQRGLAAHPAMFVGFMSGGHFWPAWKEKRNVFSDPMMLERSVAFARESAELFAEFKDTILSVDQGNEICCLPDTWQASPAAVINWCGRVNEAVKSVWPGAIMISGNEQGQFAGDSGWRLGDQPGCDLYSMHGYPVPAWHPTKFDGMADPLAQSLLPFYTQVARSFGPVMLQEFGAIPTFGPDRQETYLRAMLPAAWHAGANGFLYWCMRDITTNEHPYAKGPFEKTLGLIGADDQMKPGVRYFLEFAKTLTDSPPPSAAGPIGIYFPRHYYNREMPLNPGNDPGQLSRSMSLCNYLLRTLGHTPSVVRGDQMSIPKHVKTLVITGAALDVHEMVLLRDWVNAGGKLIWHGVDTRSSCDTLTPLIGAAAIDFRASRRATLNVFEDRWNVRKYPSNCRSEFRPTTAKVLFADRDDVGQVFLNRCGGGSVFWTIAVIEEAIALVSHQPAQRDRWADWYRGALNAVDVVG